ncbi:MAG: S9 family peptidase [Lewinellaceae bacterium]|nr:S9 family peptidase [Saprospiraceae bacterium]MCB9333420.1 S9 family peptidase [Lewinellaceae bacterium]
MMKNTITVFVRYCLLLVLPAMALTAQKPITLEDIWSNNTFETKTLPGFRFQNDGAHYTVLNDAAIEQFDLRSGKKTAVLFDAATVPEASAPGWTGTFENYTFSADESKILLASDVEAIYRHSKRATYFVFDTKSKKITRLHGGVKLRYPTFSPDGNKVAYVLENDLYVLDLASGKNARLTNDGAQNAIINGASDWVYEEEFALVRAFEWSPDSRKIAYLRFDERAVPEYTIEMYRGGDYPEPVTFKYPKVGEPNSTVTAHIADLASAKTIPVKLPTPQNDPNDPNTPEYLPRIAWTPDGRLCLTRLNRHQNHLTLLLADPATGACTRMLEESSDYYLDLQEPVFLADGSGFIWQSEKSGFMHLYRYDMEGQEKAALTRGEWEVTDFYGVDAKNGLAYFQAAVENPMEREIYSVKLNGKSRKKISTGTGFHSAQFSSTHDYFVDTYSTLNAPPRYSVRDRNGNLVRQLEQNTELLSQQAECGVAPLEFFTVPIKNAPAPDGKTWSGSLNGWMLKPTAPQFQGKQLPVLMFVYGGPGSQQVTDAWKGANYWWFQMLAQKGYVVACVDNRGTGARGEAFQKMTYLDLGKYESDDQIAAAKYIGAMPFTDPARIGIFGWSYGGYMASLSLFKGNDVFEAGIAVAPVTHWKWYDNIYTERYMRTEKENPQGYSDSAPINFADQLKGNYLLVHGLADDNVHFQHSAEMSNRLIAANKQYDTMFYPNLNHGIRGGNARLHLYNLMTRFLDEKLKGVTEGARP